MATEETLGRYRLERVIGTGTFATVWLARDETLDRHVAIKILADNWSRNNDVRRRFLTEARVLLTAESPRITRGFELGETSDGCPYLVMTWADRGTLTDRMTDRSRRGELFAPHEAAAITRAIALAVGDVHELGHLHRDVKPSNVLLRSGGVAGIPGLEHGEEVLIGDFGLARGIDASAITLVAGSPGYVAPEQAAGLTQLDRRADLYSLGRIALELLTGDPGGRATTMSGAAHERVDAAAHLAEHHVAASEAFVALIDRLVATDPQDRPSTAIEVAEALTPLTAPDAHSAVPARSARVPGLTIHDTDATGTRPRRHGVVRRLGVAAALLVVAVGAIVAATRLVGDIATENPSGTAAADEPVTGSRARVALPATWSIDEDASDATRTIAHPALTVDEVIDYFASLDGPWRADGEPVESDGSVIITLTDGSRDARATVTPAAVTAGEGISRVVIVYGS